MYKIYNKETRELLGQLGEEELAFLEANLVKESLDDHDYYITRETIEQWSREGTAPARLVHLLQGGIRSGEAIEIQWEKMQIPAAL